VGDPTEVLAAFARGVLGEEYLSEVGPRMRARIEEFPSSDRTRLLRVLRAIDGPAGAFALTGRANPASRLSPEQAEALIQRLLQSRVGPKRTLAKALVALSTSAVYGFPGPQWQRIGYPGPLGPPPAGLVRPLHPLKIDSSQELTCDVAIVGSGAGGGCVAAGLARAGLDVIVLEKGGYHAEEDFTHLETESLSKLYLYGATLATTDLGVAILAGSTLGGGTVVNYSTCFRPPDAVLSEWAADTGISAFVSGEFEEYLDEVAARIGVTTEESAPARREELMEVGLRKLGWQAEVLARAVRGCPQDDQCGYCGFGCRRGAKQSAVLTFLEDAARDGARLVVGADARKVLIRDGRAIGVGVVANGHRVVVRARAVVAAGGSIETPALLLRSGLRGQVGRNLHLHPGIAAFGVFDEPVRPWAGTLQARHSPEFWDMDGGYGLLIESVPLHPGLGSAALPWASARQHRDLMDRLSNLAMCAAAPRDRTQGRVSLARDGSVRVRYPLSKSDERLMVEGLIAGARVMEAAGATEVFSLHHRPLTYRPEPGAHERWADDVRRVGIRGRLTSFSFHQMGSCRMGADPAESAVGPDNQTHQVRDLFVVDSSVFPTALGVNPMLTVYAFAHRAAGQIAARLA
jgi:choline dehydrogenase-like flavoprotein